VLARAKAQGANSGAGPTLKHPTKICGAIEELNRFNFNI